MSLPLPGMKEHTPEKQEESLSYTCPTQTHVSMSRASRSLGREGGCRGAGWVSGGIKVALSTSSLDAERQPLSGAGGRMGAECICFLLLKFRSPV